MKIGAFYGVTYEEHRNILFGDYVKISLRDWKAIQKVVEEYFTEKKERK